MVVATILGGSLVSASPAAAAYPKCTTVADVTATDGSGKKAWVPVSSAGSTTCDLRYGDYNNQAVLNLQASLNQCYAMGLTVDGDFGSATQTALKSVQGLIGVTQDGQYGPFTRDRLRHRPYLVDDICHLYNGPGGY